MRSADSVMRYFHEICSIPHPSFQMEEISDYCVNFAKERGLAVTKDEACNVVIRVPGTSSRRFEPPVILQAHLDMVPAVAAGVDFDFSKDSLKVVEEDDWIFAEGTSLGADDGIGVALCLALINSDDIPHPPLICVFTANEEVGMLGAKALDMSSIKASRMINLDHCEEGSIVIGCAGGATAELTLPIERKEITGKLIRIEITGMKGGHSGEKIHLGGANALRMPGRIIREMVYSGHAGFGLAEYGGGTAENAIPKNSFCVLAVPEENAAAIQEAAEAAADILRARWRKKEPGMKIEITSCDGSANALTFESTRAFARLIRDMPNGLMKMSDEMLDLPETSLNLGKGWLTEDAGKLVYLLRSSVDAEKERLKTEVENIVKDYGGTAEFSSDYPGWPIQLDSPLQNLAGMVWKWETDETLEITATHGGLECGVFAAAYPDMDIISIGPTMLDIHTSGERLSLSSVELVWNFLTQMMEQL
ncbi:MAG: beta-Ala-His dipeptidase [Lachnospiraceae bacterium]|nr:beta-Ala-His dipeptidase [Lachnospiraceae bacterium]